MSEKLVQVAEQKTVLFLDDKLLAVRAVDSEVYVSLGHLCDALELDRQGQSQRIERSQVMLSGYRQGPVETSGGVQTAYLLRVDLVPFWLAGLNTSRIKDDMRRAKVEQYQRNVAKVLWEAFQEGRLTSDPDLEELLSQDTEAVQAYKMLQAMVKLARNQILIENRLTTQSVQLENHEERLEQIESTLGTPDRHVTPEQASQISQAVKAVALVLSKRSGSNQYGSVYGELYRKFGITSYKLLSANRFEQAMKFLTDWHQDLVGDAPF